MSLSVAFDKEFPCPRIHPPKGFPVSAQTLPVNSAGPNRLATCSLHNPTVLEIEVEGIPFSVIYAPVERPDQLAVVCRLGTLPPVDQAPILRRLLELSFFLAGSEADVGMDPTGDDALMTIHTSLAAVSAASLVQSLRMQAGLAKKWRANHFLTSEPGVGPSDLLVNFWRKK